MGELAAGILAPLKPVVAGGAGGMGWHMFAPEGAHIYNENIPFPYVVREVIKMGRAPHLKRFACPGKQDDAIVEQVMANVGIEYLQNKRVNEISGGERQLVAIARTLAQQPEAIIMDEPTSALDFKNQVLVLRMIEKLADQGMTVIMSSHFPNHALLFDTTVAMMRDGRLITVGEANTVITEENLSQTYRLPVKILSACDESDKRLYRFVIPANRQAGQNGESGVI